MAVNHHDLALSYQFSIEVSGMINIEGYFQEISGIQTEYDAIEYKRVSAFGNPKSSFVPGRPKYNPITLKRGVTQDLAFWMWHEGLSLGMAELLRCNVSITLHDREFYPMVRWDLNRAWPSKVTGPQMNAGSSDIAIEEITLVHEGLKRSFMRVTDLQYIFLRAW